MGVEGPLQWDDYDVVNRPPMWYGLGSHTCRIIIIENPSCTRHEIYIFLANVSSFLLEIVQLSKFWQACRITNKPTSSVHQVVLYEKEKYLEMHSYVADVLRRKINVSSSTKSRMWGCSINVLIYAGFAPRRFYTLRSIAQTGNFKHALYSYKGRNFGTF